MSRLMGTDTGPRAGHKSISKHLFPPHTHHKDEPSPTLWGGILGDGILSAKSVKVRPSNKRTARFAERLLRIFFKRSPRPKPPRTFTSPPTSHCPTLPRALDRYPRLPSLTQRLSSQSRHPTLRHTVFRTVLPARSQSPHRRTSLSLGRPVSLTSRTTCPRTVVGGDRMSPNTSAI